MHLHVSLEGAAQLSSLVVTPTKVRRSCPLRPIEGRGLDGDWTGAGFYGVTNDDRICLSWHGRDQGRLRCLSVVMIEDVPHKFRADGSESGALVRIEDGKAW